MKIISWNVNGIRAAITKGFLDYFNELDADIFCIQETKCQVGQVDMELPGYFQYWHQAEKKGYSGTAVFTKKQPINVRRSGIDFFDDNEGRILELEFDDFYFVNCYVPNSKRDLSRIPFRMNFEDRMREYLLELNKKKGVIYCGDLNVAHKEIDLKNPSQNRMNAGFTDHERGKFQELMDVGFIDTFRYFYPDRENIYTWWSYFAKSRDRNIGWRIDYVIVSPDLKERLQEAKIHDHILGSDHCPVELIIN